MAKKGSKNLTNHDNNISKKINLNESIINFLKGLFMGFSDIIPGVSGGTIALITGVYSRFMKALKNINLFWIIPFLLSFKNKKNQEIAKKEFFRMDPYFMIPLGVGIIFAILIGSMIIPYLMDNYTIYTYSFFFGLILASAIYLICKNIIYKQENKNNMNYLSIIFLLIGISVGFFITGLEEIFSNNNLLMLLIAGFFAVFAMLLPGISGSFLLLILGQYKYILNALHNFWNYYLDLVVFIFGMVMGLIIGSRIIFALLKKYYNITLFFLIGLMLGALRLPFNEISFNSLDIVQLFFVFLVLISAMLFVFIINIFEFKKNKIKS
jgi:putative membrane protein